MRLPEFIFLVLYYKAVEWILDAGFFSERWALTDQHEQNHHCCEQINVSPKVLWALLQHLRCHVCSRSHFACHDPFHLLREAEVNQLYIEILV